MITLLLCFTTKSQAQWEAPFSHYWVVKGYYNPSFAGDKDQISTAGVYQFRETELKEAHRRILVTADMPFEFMQRKHGAGIIAYTESFGSLRNSLLAAQYSYKQQLSGGMVNIGIHAGIFDLKYDIQSIRLIHDPQNNIQQNINTNDKQVADLTAGISWSGSRFYAGLSVMHLNQPGFYISSDSITGQSSGTDTETSTSPQNNNNLSYTDSTRSHIPRTYNFIAGYNIVLFNSLELQPMAMVLHDKNQTVALATVQLQYDKRFSGGFTLTTDNGYSLFAGAAIQGFRFGYAYATGNNHEFYIKYDFSLESFKPKLQHHKSIRLL